MEKIELSYFALEILCIPKFIHLDQMLFLFVTSNSFILPENSVKSHRITKQISFERIMHTEYMWLSTDVWPNLPQYP